MRFKDYYYRDDLISALLCALAAFVLSLPAECAILDLNIKDTDSSPVAGMIFQVFPGRVNIDSDTIPIKSASSAWNEELSGYVANSDGKLQIDLPDGLYTFVGSSQDRYILLVQEVTVPGSVVINAADAVPVSINCRASNGSPIPGAEIFFRPTKQARASVGYANNSGLLNARISNGRYHAVLRAIAGKGPHYLVLPRQAISQPKGEVNFRVAEIPTCEVSFDLPKATAIAIFEVLESTYTREYAEGVEPEIGYDAAYTDFYPLISADLQFTLSANMSYNFNMSFAVIFGAGRIYAYELLPAIHSIQPGIQRIGTTEKDIFTLQILSDRGDKNPVYHPGDVVNLNYYFMDGRGNLLNRILNFSDARLIFPMVTIWDPHGVPIANNFDTDRFYEFNFSLPRSAMLGSYRAEVSLDAGIYGRITGDFRFQVSSDSDSEPPQIVPLDLPAAFEAGQELVIKATISDNFELAEKPKLRLSVDGKVSWKELSMVPEGLPGAAYDSLYQAYVPSAFLTPGELSWQISAQDLAGNRAEQSGTINIMDTSPPIINHELITMAELGRDLRVQADITDNVGIAEAILLYKVAGKDPRLVKMPRTGEVYSVSIPGSEIAFDELSYYIRATDTSGNVALLPVSADEPKFAYVKVKDTIAPAISHTPVSVGIANTPIKIEAIIMDNSGIAKAMLFYKNLRDQNYESINMSNIGGIYFAEIPASAVVLDGLQYHITASDGGDPEGNVRTSTDPVNGGDYQVEIRSESYGIPTSLEISPSALQSKPLDITVGESVRFKAFGRGKSGELLPADVTWAAIGGIGYIAQDGSFLAAGRITGDGIGRVLATAGRVGAGNTPLQVEAWVRISAGRPARIILNPSSITIKAGEKQQFFATVTDIYSNPLGSYGKISWRLDKLLDEKIGAIEPTPGPSQEGNGIFIGSKAGEGRVVVELNGIEAASDVIVTPGPLRKIVIQALEKLEQKEIQALEKLEAVVAGNTIQFTAMGYDDFSNQIYIAPIWSVRGGVGVIRGDGLFRGGTAGSGQVVATVGDIPAKADVRVTPGQLASVSVKPYVAYVPVSTDKHQSTQQFVADGWDIAGNPVPLKSVSWTTDALAGTISASGLFTAVTDPGVRVSEIVTNGTIWATGTAITTQATGKSTVVIQKSPASRLSSISVVVQGTSDESKRVSLATGESVRFEAVGSDAKGRRISIAPSWSVEGGIGDINVSGLFTARMPGSGAVVATAGGFTSAMKVEVTLGALKSVAIKPDMLVLTPGAQNSITVVGYDSFENIVPLQNVRWSVEGDAVTIEPAGTSCVILAPYTRNPSLFDEVGTYSTISARIGDLVAFSNIFVSTTSVSLTGDITDPAQAQNTVSYYLEVAPDLIDLMPGSQQQFTVRAVDTLGNTYDSGKLSWSVTGDIGEIDGSGIFRAGNKSGAGRVIVTDGRVFGTAVVTVSDPAVRGQGLLIIPSQMSLTAGVVQKLTAFVMAGGELRPILPAWKVIGSIGSIDSAGRFVAVNAGNGEVEAAIAGLTARCRVNVSTGKPAWAEIQPNSLSIKAGKQQKFSVVCKDSEGNIVTSSPVFQIAGDLGTIDDSGIFTARKAGSGSVIAAAGARGSFLLMSTADIVVLPGDLTKIELAPEDQEVSAGGTVRFSALGKDAYGNSVIINPEWDIVGLTDIGSISSNGLFTANRVGQDKVRAKAGKITGTASIRVRPGAPAFILVEPALLSISSQADDAKQFSFKFLDSRGNTVEGIKDVKVSWTVTAGIGFIDPQTGLFVNERNLNEPRTGYVTATAVFNTGSDMERTIRGMAAVVLQPVEKPLATITVTPDPALVIKGDAQRFIAVGKDADGVEQPLPKAGVVWKVVSSDGSLIVPNAISSDGIFKATVEMKVGSSWKVLASALNSEGRSIQDEAKLNLIAGPLQLIEVICQACAAPVESGKVVEMEAIGYDQFHNKVQISPDWKITGGIGTVNPLEDLRSKANITAGLAGSGEVIASAEGKEGKAYITVKPGQIVEVIISTDPAQVDANLGKSPANPMLIKAGSDIRFVASGRDSSNDILGRSKPMNTIPISPAWSVKPSDEKVDLGSISSDGRFSGRGAGVGRIDARFGQISASFYIAVTAGDLRTIRVSPSSVSVVSGTEEKQKFLASGYDLYGNQITKLQPIAWRVTGNIGDIDENGSYVPISLPAGSAPVSGTVVASAGSIQGSSSVTVVPASGKLTAISVTVEPDIVQAGNRAICTLKGIDELGYPMTGFPVSAELNVSVPERLGSVASSDKPDEWIFRAEKSLSSDPNERSGTLTATVKLDGQTLSSNTLITLIPGPLSRISVEPASMSISAGQEQRLKASGYDPWGNERDLQSPEWAMSNSLGSMVQDTYHPQEAVFTAKTAGQCQLTVKSQGYEGKAELTIIPGEPESLAVDPKAITIAAGSSHRFIGTGKDGYGNNIVELNLQWQVTGDLSIGSVTVDGTFSAKRTGNCGLKVIHAGISDEASITVIPGPIASAGISIYKDMKALETPYVLLCGVQYALQIQGTDLWGNQVSQPVGVNWGIEGDTGSTISFARGDSTVVLTALFPGRGKINAKIAEITASADFEIVPHSCDVSSHIGGKIGGPFDASIDIPPGALRTDEKISIALSPSPGPSKTTKRVGHAYKFEPDGKIFEIPAELTLFYSSVDISETDHKRLSLYSWDRFQECWIRVGGVVNQYQKSITAAVNYLSIFTIMDEEPGTQVTLMDNNLKISDVRLSPNTYFAPEINRLTIQYNISFTAGQPVTVTVKIYDIRGHLSKQLLDKVQKYPGWNTDQWDGTNEDGEIVKNGRYFLLITAEADSNKVSITKHLAVFK